MEMQATLTVDGRQVAIGSERNLLEVIRHANIELPTFCYHSELSVYGACRLCLVEVAGRGIVAACSTPPEPGMRVRTSTEEIRQIRRISIELLLANHKQSCPTCSKSASCQLQKLARQLGVQKVRFKPTLTEHPVDESSPWLVRDPNKCVLCGDCVRACSEIQGIGAIDFVRRGSSVAVSPAFGKNLDQVECVGCGQCARVCPTGALVPRSQVEAVWKVLDDPDKVVVAQVAPAVRVALGELFGMDPGAVTSGQIVASLKQMGFRKVFDTAFAADMTAIEETGELLKRRELGVPGPLFTSCCPAWVRFAEQYFPQLLPRLSTCRSPQQMLGAVVKHTVPERLGIAREHLVMVSIMPCTAKKGEAQLSKFSQAANPDVDFVLTTQELGHMIEEAGIRFQKLEPEPFDMPFGFNTGAGVVFGASGGVAEAVIRCAAEKLGALGDDDFDLNAVRGEKGLRELSVQLGTTPLRFAVVHGLAAAKVLAERVLRGEASYDLVEVMACPGGCVSGAGNPSAWLDEVRVHRAKGLFKIDKMLALHAPQDNPFVRECYQTALGGAGSAQAHQLLHTGYHSRRRIAGDPMSLVESQDNRKIQVQVCVGTSCFLRGAQSLLRDLMQHIDSTGAQDTIEVKASFCQESCQRGPMVVIDGKPIEHCDFATACKVLDAELTRRGQLEPPEHDTVA